MTWLDTIILSIVEGITEFLPISSTGHMIIASSILGISEDNFVKLFEICVQLGAILSVIVLYWKKFFDFSRKDFYLKLIIAVLPALVIGKLLAKKIDQFLESPTTVALALLIGGVILLFVDKLFKDNTIDHEKDMSWRKGLIIGFWQVLAMIPGTSRSAATIVGGMQQKLTRRFAAEFSFFLAVPTMIAATGYKMFQSYKDHPEILKDKHNLMMLGVGNVIAFVVAMVAIKTFIHFLQKHGLRMFGIYRIIAAAVIFLLMYQGVIRKASQTDKVASLISRTSTYQLVQQ
jgi:undecaprenyl-diphosphatase